MRNCSLPDETFPIQCFSIVFIIGVFLQFRIAHAQVELTSIVRCQWKAKDRIDILFLTKKSRDETRNHIGGHCSQLLWNRIRSIRRYLFVFLSFGTRLVLSKAAAHSTPWSPSIYSIINSFVYPSHTSCLRTPMESRYPFHPTIGLSFDYSKASRWQWGPVDTFPVILSSGTQQYKRSRISEKDERPEELCLTSRIPVSLQLLNEKVKRSSRVRQEETRTIMFVYDFVSTWLQPISCSIYLPRTVSSLSIHRRWTSQFLFHTWHDPFDTFSRPKYDLQSLYAIINGPSRDEHIVGHLSR